MAASFQNMATLTYTGGTVDSNIVTGELREVLTVVKTAVNKATSWAAESPMLSVFPTAARWPSPA